MNALGLITSIEREKRGPNVAIVVDGTSWLSVHRDVALEAGLRKGDPADEALKERLVEADERRRAYESALLLLSYRPRAEGELRQRLRRKGLPEPAIDQAMERLKHAGLVNDEQFARAWVDNRGSGSSARGRARLTAELRTKGVPNEVVGEAVQGVDEREQALQVARIRGGRLTGTDYQEFRRRLAGFLQRRGFGYDAIGTAVRTVWQEIGAGGEPADESDQ